MTMATPNNNKGPQLSSKAAQPQFAPAPANKASSFLEKARPGMRRSTPDSEALASSDDEIEQNTQNQAQFTPVGKPTRRTSMFTNDSVNTHTLPRKSSIPTGGSFSASSNPTSPSTEQSSWGPTSPALATSVNWGSSGGGSYPWGSGIWSSETRKEPPSRLAEVLQSPTSTNPPNQIGTSSDEILSPTSTRTMSGDSSIPFAIPLHPTPKTYRSQSYSVGQLDPESGSQPPSNPPLPAGRGRYSAQFPVQRRGSRQSMLGELGHDPASLGRVREDEDDGSTNEPDTTYNNPWASNQARTIEQLTLENAMLRQAASNQMEGPRFRDRTLSSASANSGYSLGQQHKLRPIQGSVPEESTLAVEDMDEQGELPGYNNSRGNMKRRYSEHSANLEKQFPTFTALENRTLENMKRAQWQSSLGFGGMPDIPQSRRHSFADVPSRHPLTHTSPGDSQAPVGPLMSSKSNENGVGSRDNQLSPSAENSEYYRHPEKSSNVAVELEHLRARQMAAGFFTGREHPLRPNESTPSTGMSTSLHQAYVMPNSFGRQQHPLAQPHPNQQLFIVTFKCCRADVFYVQEDTGLQVKPGELVIVEADRGTDLGTVAHANVSWARAREYKEHYAEEHYKWLMLFSRQSQSGAPNAVNPNGPSSLSGAHGSAVGGMGPQSHASQEPQSGEIKPKLIKRLAQNHEIQTLRDKEGNEAKAKRVCQQKVAEHRLNMEILDAEFQMDWKKLTFYYFADTYINFNSLVTDLFKIYKTRIWMSAINPASFATPTAGLHPGQGAVPFSQDSQGDRRRTQDYKPFGMGINQGLAPGAFADQANPDTGGAGRASFMDPYQAFNVGGRGDPNPSGYSPNMQRQNDPFSPFPSANYGSLDPNAPEYGPNSGTTPGGMRHIGPGQNDWMNSFQGLSLGS